MADFRYAQICPLARAAEILGERWTLLLIRELFCGPQRFSDLRRRLPGVSSSVLSDRLARLEERGIVRRRELPPPAASQVYELDAAGRALERPLGELMRWGLRWVEPRPGDHFEPEWLGLGMRFFARRDGAPDHGLRVVVEGAEPGDPPALDLTISGGPGGTRIAPVEDAADDSLASELTLRGPGLVLLAAATRTAAPRDLLAAGALQAEGDLEVLDLFPDFFDFSPDAPAGGREAGA